MEGSEGERVREVQSKPLSLAPRARMGYYANVPLEHLLNPPARISLPLLRCPQKELTVNPMTFLLRHGNFFQRLDAASESKVESLPLLHFMPLLAQA